MSRLRFVNQKLGKRQSRRLELSRRQLAGSDLRAKGVKAPKRKKKKKPTH